MSRILVTGGAGFIGSHIVDALNDRRHDVVVLDNLSRGKYEYLNASSVEFIHGDVRYADVVETALADVDCVFHEAATNINRSVAYPEESLDVNLRASDLIFSRAAKRGIKVIFASSASVYGQPKVLPMSEDHEKSPVTPYCAAKFACEHLLEFYARQHGLKYVALRYFNVYGLRQHSDAYYTSVITLFLKRLLAGEPPIIQGDGKQSMDFVHVKDVVRANLLAMDYVGPNDVFNVGTGKSTTIRRLAELLVQFSGSDVEPIFEPRKVIVTERKACIKKAEKYLGFLARVAIEDGLKEVAEDIINNPEKY